MMMSVDFFLILEFTLVDLLMQVSEIENFTYQKKKEIFPSEGRRSLRFCGMNFTDVVGLEPY